MPTNRFLDAATSAAARGWHVFPLWPDCKRPAIRAWPAQATADLDRIRHWWSTNPRFNVGLATGASGLHVLDLDTHHDQDGPEALYRLAKANHGMASLLTYTVATPSGGRHLYYRVPEGLRLPNTVARIGPGVDSRGHGGYVVAAGSRTSAGDYRVLAARRVADLPSWLRDLLTPQPPPELMTPGEPLRHPDAYVHAIVTAESRKVRAAAPGTRNSTLFRAAFTLGRLVAGDELDAVLARDTLTTAATIHIGHHDFTAREVDRTIANGLSIGANRPRRLTRSR